MTNTKLTAVLLSAVVAVGALAGCSSSAPPEKIKVGVLLPSDDSGGRWDTTDAPVLENVFKGNDFAYQPDIEEDADSPAKASATATTMINDGARVLVFAAANRETEAAIASTAKARGIPTVGYDWNDTAPPADYVVAVDQEKVGELQARGVIRGVRSSGKAAVVTLAPSGPSAARRAAGERNALQPRYDVGSYSPAGTEQVTGPQAVAPALTKLLTANGGKVDAVLAGDDALAQAAIAVLRQRGLAGKTVVTGYGATPEGLKAVLRGDQFMTVYTPPADQATAAGNLARALAVGDQAAIDRLVPPARGPGQPRTLLVEPKSVTLDTITDVFTGGAVESDSVCEGDLAPRCNQLSIP